MSETKSFLLRLPKPILDAYAKWAEDELRSLNGQLEYVLRNALKAEGRLPKEFDPSRAAAAEKKKGAGSKE